jgi:hypothetical protein
MEHRDNLVGELGTAKSRLAGLLQCESSLKVSQTVEGERAERQLPAFTRAS